MGPRAAWRLESLGFTSVFIYKPGKLDWVSAGLPVEGTAARIPNLGTVARRDVVTCRLSDQISAVKARIAFDPTGPCPVVNDQRIVLGLVRSDVIKETGTNTAEEVMIAGPVTFRPNVALEEIDRYLTDHKTRHAVVTTPEGQLIGLASAEDVHRRHADLAVS
ncbi:MAG: CBS domain-containing protein [Chloroflexi bacterium]|nr:MAG: CBS domain-containing protein [Chloroflexota bacterium]